MRFKNLIFGLIILLFVGCNKKNEQIKQNSFPPKVIDAKGYIVPSDSIKQPVIIELDESKLKKVPAGKFRVVAANTNIRPVGTPDVIKTGKPKICFPGKDTCLLPLVKPVIDSPFLAPKPEIVYAKDPYIKEQNPHNFSYFGKLQGLKQGYVSSLMQDNFGNIWIGTSGGGATKYDGKTFTTYDSKQGMKNNNIICIFQDRSGDIWFGTHKGVHRFDGKYLSYYGKEEGFSSSRIYSIFQDKSGYIWFSTYGDGVIKYDGKVTNTSKAHFYHYNEKQGLCFGYINTIKQDIYGNMWFGSDGGGLSIFIDNSVNGKEPYFLNYSKTEGLPSNNINAIISDLKGNIWLATNKGVWKVNDLSTKDNYLTCTIFSEKQGITHDMVYSLILDKTANFWLGTYGGGISKLSLNKALNNYTSLKQESITNFTEQDGLGNNKVNAILEDRNGNIWIGTNKGVNKYDGKIFTNFTSKEGLPNSYAYSLYKDSGENIWIGTEDGGIARYDNNTLQSGQTSFSFFATQPAFIGKNDNNVLCIFEDNMKNIWFGTYEEGAIKYDGQYFTRISKEDGLADNTVLSILQDNENNLWFSTTKSISKYSPPNQSGAKNNRKASTLTNFKISNGLSKNNVYTSVKDNEGNLWFGTYDGGITKVEFSKQDKEKIEFIHYTTKEGLSSNNIYTAYKDSKGNLWFGTNGGGTIKYDGTHFTIYTEKQGLSNNVVYSIIEDNAGDIWMGTRFGLSRLFCDTINLDSTRPMFKRYTHEDGFLGVGCNRSAIEKDKFGNIWIAANDRLTVYHPDGDARDTVPPITQMTALDLFNESIDWTGLESKKDSSFKLGNGVKVGNVRLSSTSKWYALPENLSLAWNNNFLTFHFIGVTTKSPQKVMYEYMLEGLDENWSALTSKTEAPYGNLPHGTYTFKVKAMNSEGYWSKEFSYTFTIRPPWWKTWWFRIIEFLSVLLLIFGYIKWRERKLKKDKELLARKVKEQTIELHDKNEELKSQNEEITAQRDEIHVQKNIIEHKNKNITDSIRYAQRIQHAILPRTEKMKELLNDHFVLYHPKDIVSGDFYWVEECGTSENDTIALFAAVDCTGHGVPGAFMSLLGHNGLQQAVKESKISKPGDILNFLNNYIRAILREQKEDFNVKDGMDIFLCAWNKNKMLLEYAGVHNSAFLVRNGEIITLKPDQQAIGEAFTDKFTGYTNNQLKLEKNDCIYLFTDGYIDQFGGSERKKFMKPRFKELLLEIHSLKMEEQHRKLEENYDKWKGDELQIDDVLIIGVKI